MQTMPPMPPAGGDTTMKRADLDDMRSTDPVERLLEDSWKRRSRRLNRRELVAESLAAAAVPGCAVPLALAALASHAWTGAGRGAGRPLRAGLGLIKFPIGAGYVVPSYLVLVPMLLLLPPGMVPLLTAAGLVLGTLGQVGAGRLGPERVLFSIPDAWHALGPALVLRARRSTQGGWSVGARVRRGVHRRLPADLVSATRARGGGYGYRLARADPGDRARLARSTRASRRWACWSRDAARQDPAQVLLILPLIGGAAASLARPQRAHRAGPAAPGARRARAHPPAERPSGAWATRLPPSSTSMR